MSIYSSFIKRQGSDVLINGVAGKAIISSLGRSAQAIQSRREGIFLPGAIKAGDKVTEGTVSYLVIAAQELGEYAYAHLGMCNALINIQYWYVEEDEFGNIIVQEWRSRGTADAHQTFISARMRQEDPGLLATTVCTFHILASTPCELLDRVVVGTTKYQVNAIDAISVPGIKILQVSTDERP